MLGWEMVGGHTKHHAAVPCNESYEEAKDGDMRPNLSKNSGRID